MSAMKPDYFIAYNGLPNILLAHSRRLITDDCDRVSGDRQKIHPPTKSKSSVTNQQALMMQWDTEKNIRNRAIKESLSCSKANKDLINSQIVKNSGWCRRNQNLSSPKSVSTDNSECNRNFKRWDTIESDMRDNKLKQQRKYDNTIFRHDLPDRLILPPLPV